MFAENVSDRRRPAPANDLGLVAAFRLGDELEALEAAALSVRALKADADLTEQDGTTDHLYVIREGWLCRHRTARDGRRQIMALLVPGDIANLDALMLDRPGYGLSALTDAKVAAIPRQRVLELAEQSPRIAMALARLALV